MLFRILIRVIPIPAFCIFTLIFLVELFYLKLFQGAFERRNKQPVSYKIIVEDALDCFREKTTSCACLFLSGLKDIFHSYTHSEIDSLSLYVVHSQKC